MDSMQLVIDAAAEQDAQAGDRALVPAIMQSGVVSAGTGSPGWQLLDGVGPRSHEITVVFPQAFRFFPTVQVMLTGIDILDGANHRLHAFPKDVTKGGFKLVFHTWSDTRVWSVAATWIAHST